MGHRILIVDDDRAFRMSTAALLREDGYEVVGAADGREGVEALRAGSFDLMLLDLRMPGIDGIRVVEALRTWGEGVPILMISGFGTVDAAVKALHAGADDFLTKPVEPGVLSSRVAQLVERRPQEHARPVNAQMVGRSRGLREVLEQISKVAPTEATVLITGETGTGKELIARAIHAQSARASAPFVAVNCAALAEGVLESELFGHVRGAFTGAHRDRTGLFESADGGTILLDEIGDVSPSVQHRLLRVLEERELTPVGSVSPRSIDVRVVAATHQDLTEAITAGRFREDLYYRLNVFRIEVPPLRERQEDIPLLVDHFLAGLSQRLGSATQEPGPSCSPLALRLLRAYPWPGNVRELLSALQSSVIRAGGKRIEAQHLPREVREAASGVGRGLSRYRVEEGGEDEKERIVRALREADGVRAKAAEVLGMGRTTLWRKMKQYGLEADEEEE